MTERKKDSSPLSGTRFVVFLCYLLAILTIMVRIESTFSINLYFLPI